MLHSLGRMVEQRDSHTAGHCELLAHAAVSLGMAMRLDSEEPQYITVQAELPWETTLTLSIQNIFDSDPPDAPSNYNYDYTTGNPLGRVFEIGVKKRF